MPTKKDGTKITWKEYFKLWKEGIKNITPVQKLENDRNSTFTMFIGYLVGLIALIIKFNMIPNKLLSVGLIIIFLGATWSNLVKWWVLKIQVKLFKGFNTNAINLNEVFNKLEEVKEEVEVNEKSRRNYN